MAHLGLHAYKVSEEIDQHDYPFYAMVASLMKRADTMNAQLLKAAWPEVWTELEKRYNAPGGVLEGEH